MTTFSDNFSRADGDPGTNWTQVSGTWSIISQQLSSGSAGGTIILRATGAMSTSDHFVQITIAATAAVSHGIWARGNSNISQGYLVRNNGSSWDLFSVVGGSFTVIGTYAVAAAAGDIVKLQAVGSAIKVYINGTLRISVTDTAVTTGTSVGVRAESTSSLRFDDFSAADVTNGVTGDAALAATATLSAAGTRSTTGDAALAATANLTASGVRSTSGDAGLAATAGLTADGTRTATGGASLAATAVLTASGAVTTSGGATLAATATLSADGQRTAIGDAALTATASFTADGQRTATTGAGLAATAALTADGARTAVATAGLAATAALVAAGTTNLAGGAALAATATLTASGTVQSSHGDSVITVGTPFHPWTAWEADVGWTAVDASTSWTAREVP